MSLGVGSQIGVGEGSQAPSTTLDTVYFGMNGDYVALGWNTDTQLERFWTGNQRNDQFENGFMIEDGKLKEFYFNAIQNSLNFDTDIYISESNSDGLFLASQGGLYSPILVTIPAGISGVVSNKLLDVTLKKGKYYAFVAVPRGAATGTMIRQYSYKCEFGNNPVMPTKYARMNRELEIGSNNGAKAYNFNRQTILGSVAQWGIPLPFNGKISGVAISKFQKPASGAWLSNIYKNGVLANSHALTLNLLTEHYDPNVDFVAGDVFALEISQVSQFNNASFTVTSIGWTNLS